MACASSALTSFCTPFHDLSPQLHNPGGIAAPPELRGCVDRSLTSLQLQRHVRLVLF